MVRDVVGTLARVGLAAVWLISGGLKAADPSQTYLTVSAFDVLPAAAVGPVAAALPFVELAIGVLLLVGFGVRPAAVASTVLLVAFVAGVGQAWARGLSIDCGCFGGGGPVDPSRTRYPQELARDLGFLLLAVWLVVRPHTLLAADALLVGRPAIAEDGG
ncbi:MAG TPA: MauE/DoxX family redox-associated membrane protein [Pseudonocardiaceae bacterium]